MRAVVIALLLVLAGCGGGSPLPPADGGVDPVGTWRWQYSASKHHDYSVAGVPPVYGASLTIQDLSGFVDLLYYTLSISGESFTMHGINSGAWLDAGDGGSLEETWSGTIKEDAMTGTYTRIYRKKDGVADAPASKPAELTRIG
jgi:predicted small lipoprotein YifL